MPPTCPVALVHKKGKTPREVPEPPALRAPCASDALRTSLTNAKMTNYGTGLIPIAEGQRMVAWSPKMAEQPCGLTGNDRKAADLPATPFDTYVQAAEVPITALKAALEQRRHKALTPYNPDVWKSLLVAAGLIDKYPHIPDSLHSGFSANVPQINTTYAPPNHPSVENHKDVFEAAISKELTLGRYLGPYSQVEVELAIGKFQTSPMSIIPKPGKPGKFRLIQNLSSPHSPVGQISSINSRISSDLYPCSYGTFSIISLLISQLPPGSQAALRDVSEAYRTVPLNPSEWPGLVVRTSPTSFAIDTCLCFGFGPSGGIYGNLAGAGTDLLRANGIGPISRWVDDHIFFRIRREDLILFNEKRAQTAEMIKRNGGLITRGGRQWYQGDPMPNGSHAEFDDDHRSPIRDLSNSSSRSETDQKYTYNFEDIDALSHQLGIPWESSKDVPFSTSVPYLGLIWDLELRVVTLSESKRSKYLLAIKEWNKSRTHSLNEVQKLHGKLLHAALVIPAGRAYLIHLEAMLGIFSDSPFKPRTPPHGCIEDLLWWSRILSSPPRPIRIPAPCFIHDFTAFSDASSGVGIGIVLGERWQAWTLRPEWNSDGRDIGWAESVGFELLVRHIVSSGTSNIHFKVFGDNRGVVEAGGMDAVETNPQMTPSNAFIPSWMKQTVPSSPNTFPAEKIQQMDPPVAFIPPHISVSRSLLSPMPSSHSSAMSQKMLSPPTAVPPSNNRFRTDQVLSTTRTPPSDSASDQTISRRARATYPADLTPIPSPLCPFCPARERLKSWKPLNSRPQRGNHLPLLSKDDLSRIESVVAHAWANSTKETYGSGLLVYHVFCDSKNIPEDQRAPASAILISSFLSNLAGSYSSAAVTNYLQGVRAWHIIHGLDWSIKDDEVDALLKASASLAPPSLKRKPREPYTVEIIIAIRRHLDLDMPLHAAVFACLTTTFYATARVGEFTVQTLEAFHPEQHVKLKDVRQDRDRQGREITNFHIPRTKATPQGEDVNWARQDGPSDPDSALKNHLRVNNPLPDSPLFAYKDKRKQALKPLTRSKFLSTLSLAIKAAGMKPLSGHGIRIGSTLEYLLCNVPFDVVKIKGHWASDAFLLYLRRHAQILAPYMQAVPELHDSFLRFTMPPVRSHS